MDQKSQNEISVRREPAATPAPRHTIDTLRGEIDRLFDQFALPRFALPFQGGGRMPSLMEGWLPEWTAPPVMDLVERDEAYELTVEMPGIDGDDIDLRISDSTLSVRGEKETQRSEQEGSYHLSERSYGTVQRTIPLPEGIDRDLVTAKIENGLLRITLPKSADAKAAERRIEIKRS